MSKFYGTLQGARGPVTRCGTAGSGIEAHIRGWNHGIRVHVGFGDHAQVLATIIVTRGSNGPAGISSFTLSDKDMDDLASGSATIEIVPVIQDNYELKEEGDHFDLGVDIDIDRKIQ